MPIVALAERVTPPLLWRQGADALFERESEPLLWLHRVGVDVKERLTFSGVF